MKKTILLFTSATVLLLGSCKKEEVDTKPKDFEELKTRVIFNFAEDVAMRTYGDVNNAALKFATSVENFQISNNQGDFDKVKANWRTLVSAWEQTESFHFGPVTKGNYRAKIDTWPTYVSDLESIMASGNNLNVADVEKLPDYLRGLHAIEYLIFGVDGLKKASNCSDREKKYMVSLSRDISNNCLAIFNEWSAGSASYGSSIIYAGNNSSVFKTKKELFTTMAGGMKDLCKRLVIDNLGKPYDASDTTIVEAPYSNSSLANIALNITSLKNLYTGQYKDTGNYGLRDIVKDKNSALDGKINTRMVAIDSALSAIKMPLDSAIIFKRAETKTAIDAVDSLRSTIELELIPFIEQNISN